MKLMIEGSPKEIAALAAELQERSRHIIVRGLSCTEEEREALAEAIRTTLVNQIQGKDLSQ